MTNPGASAPQNSFAVSTASSIAPSGGIACVAREQLRPHHLEQTDAQDRALQRCDPPERPAVRVLGDQRVKLRLVFLDLGREHARERVHVPRKRLLERALEQIALVQRPDRGAALIGPTRHQARDT